MCIIIYKPKKADLTREVVRRCFDTNPDGAGYMFFDVGVKIQKGFFTFKSLWKSYRKDLNKNKSSDFVIHCRIGTSGNVDNINCHPFNVSGGLGFCHNGILSDVPVPKNSPYSDSFIFVRDVLGGLPAGWINNKPIKHLLSEYAKRASSKFAIMTDVGDVVLFNESAGVWDDCGCWFSNKTYEKHEYLYGYGGYYSYTGWRNAKCIGGSVVDDWDDDDGFGESDYNDEHGIAGEDDEFFDDGVVVPDDDLIECAGCGAWNYPDDCIGDGVGNFFCPDCANELTMGKEIK